jgi:hypothetical protein
MSYQLVQLWPVIKQEEQYESKRTRKKNNRPKGTREYDRDFLFSSSFSLKNKNKEEGEMKEKLRREVDGDRLTASRVDVASCD